VPPALIADVAGGSYPAVINILLALKDRERTGRGCHLDISMSDNVFTFMYWAMGAGAVTGTWPRNGEGIVTGGSPRYRLYAAKDGRMIAVAALEDRFWNVFCDLIALEPALRDDASNAAATAAGVARIIASEDAATWAMRFKDQDCCCSLVRELPEALADPHFVHRGIGRDVLAVHVPICVGRGFTAL
jgi:crotonobetainyl-CoA:carnitine CoA-transferase CaiB-like acyl-CoA transferase